MRKLSYLFLGLTAVTPFVLGWWVERQRREYEAWYGYPPDGKGLLGPILLGILAMFVLLMVAASTSALAYQQVERPRPFLRSAELVTFLALPPLLLLFTYFVILGRAG